MSSIIIETVSSYWSAGRQVKRTQSGWVSGNAVCCHHNGQTADNRGRGGLFVTEDTASWHCFNCGFKASWQPGRTLSSKFKKLLQWLNVPDELVNKCIFEALRCKEDDPAKLHQNLIPQFFDKALPMGAKPISEWILDPPDTIEPVLEYLLSRRYTLSDYNWHWTDEPGFDNRLIVPFYYNNRIVGYTARAIRKTKVKYISEQQPGYVFNLDNQSWDRKFVIVSEGPLDAICVDGVAVMGNEISPQQRYLISRLQREVIVVPDRGDEVSKLCEQAMEWGWSVSMPAWDSDIKDINDASKRYGNLYTLWSIMDAKNSMPLKIKLRMKNWIKGN